jgi:uncharacterized protein (TIGR03067 family)
MNAYLSWIPVLLLAFVATGGDAAAKFKGNWRVVECVTDLRSMSADELKKMEIIIVADTITVINGDRVVKYSYTLDPKAKPPTIDMRQTDDQKKVLLGLYEWKDNTLRIYVTPSGDRPKEIPAKVQAGHTLVVLERIKA